MVITDTANARYGRRLIPHVVDHLALTKPDHECFSMPRTSNPEDDWKSISFKTYANAIDSLAYLIVETYGHPEPDAFPTLAYIGPNDGRYVVMYVAAMKAGYKALFISPRNSFEAQLSLFEATDCQLISFPSSHRALVEPWLNARPMHTLEIESLNECFAHRDVPHFPYKRTFEDTERKPAAVLHTSGSTGLPKPVVMMHGVLAAFDAHHEVSELHGCRIFNQAWSGASGSILSPLPLFHAGGLHLFVTRVIFWGNPVALGIADRPLSPDLFLDCLLRVDVRSALVAPIVLEQLSQRPDAIEALRPLEMVVFGGGDIAEKAGEKLVEGGVHLVNVMSSTDYTPFPIHVIKDPKWWKWFLINSDLAGIDWRLEDGYDDVYRLVFARKDTTQLTHTCFYALPNELELDSKDLFKKHPTLPDYWLFFGRADNLIVLSNGEKLNPVETEDLITSHPAVKGALVIGSGRFQTALLIESAQLLNDENDRKDLMESLWPTIGSANDQSATHGRIEKSHIILTRPEKPLPRGGKGAIQRANAIELYKEEIDQLYAATKEAGTDDAHMSFRPDLSSQLAFAESLRSVFQMQLRSIMKLQLDSDFYVTGVDSLQAIKICSRLRDGLVASGFEHVAAVVNIGLLYKHQTLRRLGAYLFSMMAGNDQSTHDASHATDDTATMKMIWERYTENLPVSDLQRPAALEDGRTVILTGSTGMLGSYMLDHLLSDSNVAHIHCLNRAADGGIKQQREAMAFRGLSNDFSKCTFHHADTSDPNLGLEPRVYGHLLREADRIFLVAWPVNFNIPFESFEPHIRGVRHMADFASRSRKRAEVVFISTVDTCSGWDPARGPVPETRIEDLGLPSTGYGRSKLVAGLVLEDVSKAGGSFPVTIVRVGQVAGAEAEGHIGAWNRHEWFPSVIASSLHLKALPGDLGGQNSVDWLPAERMVNLIMDVAGKDGYFHGVNPSRTSWTHLAPAVQEYYGDDRIAEIVNFEDWVTRLERCESDDPESLEQNPSLKLLNVTRTIAAKSGSKSSARIFSTANTSNCSFAMREATAISPQLMVRWCKQWGF